MKNIIKFKNVYYKNVFDNINLTIESGSFVGILGDNGSGKSTLAKLINGLLKPDSGTINIFNKNTNSDEFYFNVRKKIGTVLQNPDNQIIMPTVEEEIVFGLENLGLPREDIKAKLNKILQEFDFEDTKKTSVYNLSGGQKQKLNIASVIAMEPEILIFDEPTSMLDPVSKKNITNYIYKINKNKKITTLLVTHDIKEILCADKIILLNNKKVLIFRSIKELLLSKYVNNISIPQSVELLFFLKKLGYNVDFGKISNTDCADEIIKTLESSGT